MFLKSGGKIQHFEYLLMSLKKDLPNSNANQEFGNIYVSKSRPLVP